MGTKLNLVALIMDAEFIVMDGYEVEKCKELPDGVQVSLADETFRRFNDRVVEIDEAGEVQIEDAEGNVVACAFKSKVAYIPSESMQVVNDAAEGSGLKVSLDGGLSFKEARQGVRVVYEGVDVPGEDGKGQMHVTLSEEGMVRDVWVTRDEPLDHNIGTESETVEEAVSAMVEEGS